VTEADLPARIVLVGFMGAGKTTVGRTLAKRLGWEFVDLDRAIEAHLGRPVRAIFAEQGEEAFRAEELRAAQDLAQRTHCVLAAGGGAWAQPATRAVLAAGSLTVWLRTDLQTLLRRLPPDGTRPLLADRARIPTLLAERESSYRLADLSVDTTSASPHEVADELLKLVRTSAARRVESEPQ
jgi:shikimate kinase